MQLLTKPHYDTDIQIKYGIDQINITYNTKFLGLTLDNTLLGEIMWTN
jgi:hypothetical protein